MAVDVAPEASAESERPAPRRGEGVLRLFLLGAVTLAAVGVAGRFLGWPLLTATLGPTLYVYVAHPKSPGATFRSAVVGHGAAVATALACLAMFGLWSTTSSMNSGPSLRSVGAAALALGATLAILHLCRAHYPPAAATALLIASGLARPGTPLFGLLIGLGMVILAGPLITRIPLGRAAVADGNGQGNDGG